MKEVFLLLILLLLGVATTWVFELILKSNKKLRAKYYTHSAIHFGYHIHHSTYGLALIVFNVILFLVDKKIDSPLYTAFGLGIIIMHTISDPKNRIVFIEKQKK